MKSFLPLLSLAISASATAIPALEPRQTAAEVQSLPAKYFPDSQRVKIRYGPFQLPSSEQRSVIGESGTMSTIRTNLRKPCTDCGLTAAQAGLEYADGSPADVGTGAWLHHVVMLMSGTGKRDVVCPSGVLSMLGERFFSSGNERSPTMFGDVETQTLKAMYPIAAADRINMQVELMNMKPQEQTVYFTVEWEFLPKAATAGFKQTKALWMDVTNCGVSSVAPPANKQVFTLKSDAFTIPANGQMLGTAGHLHDGGVNVNVYLNDKVICDSQATYSTTTMGGMAMSDGHDGDAHIATMSGCTNIGPVKQGDKLRIEANYDLDKHAPMHNHGDSGGLAAVMGIAIMYIALD
ncbi:hypothetical protein P152DRAFT_481382 [Eremomyces bilateralis CBS 781.70]|uniref:Uncharacterized protein n=1 Tax=Eremomyces bilateralis CBS 781.70 TaxID=1392243 RepID=A0A6G1G5E0_9PEZI|nr:uncharacterized protein P152DRAFT_481382 [Eremomyces bilateralis CBS 781.70]KAF1813274.1 hypothetical protein P152DRAFT_481382 [Eremomyces bilateralis CBS 781.70]